MGSLFLRIQKSILRLVQNMNWNIELEVFFLDSVCQHPIIKSIPEISTYSATKILCEIIKFCSSSQKQDHCVSAATVANPEEK